MPPFLHRLFVQGRNVTFLRLARSSFATVAFASLIGLAGPACRPAAAQDAAIAAVVNDQVISMADVEARVDLVLSSSSIPNNPDVRQKLQDEMLHQLIDEKLELQEATKEGITVGDSEVNSAYHALEKQNNMPAGGLDKFLQQHGITKDTLLSQIRAQMAWGRLVHERYGPDLTVSESDINDAVEQIQEHDKEPQNRVAEIFLPVDNPSQDAAVSAAAARLIDAIRHGARFAEVARQFSRSPSAAVGGDLGWEAPGMLTPDMQKIVNQMQPGTIGGPFRLTGGYYVLALIDRRAPGGDASFNLTQAVFPLADNADDATRQAVIKQAQQATANARSCDDLNAIGKVSSPTLSGPLGTVQASDLPPALRPMILSAKVAVPLPPVPVRGGIGVYMVCGKQGGSGAIDRDAIAQNLLRQRFENISQRYLGDLRRVAFIDRRA